MRGLKMIFGFANDEQLQGLKQEDNYFGIINNS